MLSKIWNFITYWYFRYTVITELYMVEKWERYTINTVFTVSFLLCWFFNYSVVLGLVAKIISLLKTVDVYSVKTISMPS